MLQILNHLQFENSFVLMGFFSLCKNWLMKIYKNIPKVISHNIWYYDLCLPKTFVLDMMYILWYRIDFTDFLQRCIESPFSRKLDLWSYLDVPRSRLVKYPLLLRQVLKFSNATSEFAADMNNLNSAIENLEGVIREVDIAMAQARANFTGIKF